MSRGLALFDFDGTLTAKDTLFDFILFACGPLRFAAGLARLSPVLLAFRLGALSNSEAKQRVLSHFFKGWEAERFNAEGERYSAQRVPHILRPAGRKALDWHKEQGHDVAVVTASLDAYLGSWCRAEGFELISTQMAFDGGRVTGRFATPNCHGPEKARRVREKYNIAGYPEIWAYGDSPSDRPLLDLAVHKFYRWKKL